MFKYLLSGAQLVEPLTLAVVATSGMNNSDEI